MKGHDQRNRDDYYEPAPRNDGWDALLKTRMHVANARLMLATLQTLRWKGCPEHVTDTQLKMIEDELNKAFDV